jgi:hypothetical protein
MKERKLLLEKNGLFGLIFVSDARVRGLKIDEVNIQTCKMIICHFVLTS